MSGAESAQPGGSPAPQPSGSPFGRFKTVVVGVMVAAVASVAAVQFASDGGGAGSAEPTGIAGSWETPPSVDADDIVRLELARSGGTFTAAGCSGELVPRETTADDEWVYRYEDDSGERGCPRRMTVTVTLVDGDTLHLEARRGGATLVAEDLRRR